MHDPIEGQFRVIGETPPSEREPWRTIIVFIESAVTLIVTLAIAFPVGYGLLLISRVLFPTGPL